MQNLANNVMFGAKEPHLISLNDFITNNLYRVASFLREISTIQKADKEEIRTVYMDDLAYTKLHRYLSENLERLSREAAGRRSRYTDTQKILELKHTMEKFSNLLGQLGPPPDTPQTEVTMVRNYALVNNNSHYNEFMRRNKHRDLNSIRSLNIFYQGGVSRGGRPVFYLIARHVPAETMDFELLIYYMLRVNTSEAQDRIKHNSLFIYLFFIRFWNLVLVNLLNWCLTFHAFQKASRYLSIG